MIRQIVEMFVSHNEVARKTVAKKKDTYQQMENSEGKALGNDGRKKWRKMSEGF